MRNDIIRFLAEHEDYVSGEEISRQLNISRAAVWKHIRTLKEDGCGIEAHTNRGYLLKSIPDRLKPEYINLYTRREYQSIKWLSSVDSTNNYGKKAARDGAPAGSIYIAESQTGGRGRLGRSWVSGAGQSVEMSFLLRPKIAPTRAPALNFAAALGICEGIRQCSGVETKIKWPNDVVHGTKKICGILTEMSADMDSVEFVVCGAGTNVNQEAFPEEVAGRAVSLRMITGQTVDRVRLAAALIDNVTEYFERYLSEGLPALLPEYRERSAVMGKEVAIVSGQETVLGVCTGFGENGELLVETADGVRAYHAGEVSVRGANDYV